MPTITKELAECISPKLRRSRLFEVTTEKGSLHDIVVIRFDGTKIAQFGIKRGSKKDAGHGWIPDQLFLSNTQAYNLAKCPLSAAEYLQILRDKGHIPPESGTDA
jgi:hypothetical protein